MSDFNNIEQRIDESLAGMRPPFDQNSIEDAKASVLSRISLGDESSSQSTSIMSKSYAWLRVAAVLAVLFIAEIAFILSGNERFENPGSEQAAFFLPDGSEITFSPGSAAEFNKYSWNWDRSLSFSGEGYFDVVPGEKFIVNTKGGDIEVLGTEFTLWADKNDLFVHCTEGSVQVSNDSGSSVLQTNEFLRVERGVITPKASYFVNGFITPRKTRSLSYESVPVGIVISELEKVFGVEIKNDLPSNLIYSGILDISDENQCFQVFCKPFGAIFDKNADGHVSIHL